MPARSVARSSLLILLGACASPGHDVADAAPGENEAGPGPIAAVADAGASPPGDATTGDGWPAAERSRQTNKELLGAFLFEDNNFSEPAGLSCASCHLSAQAFTGSHDSTIAGVALGSRPGQFGARNAPSAMYASFSPAFGFALRGEDDPEEGEMLGLVAVGGQFWDGRAKDLAEQAKGPFLNPREMNNPSKTSVVEKVRTAPYRVLWDEVYGAALLDTVDAAYDAIADAIATFEATARFHPFSSKFDDVLRGKAEFAPDEQRGFDLFRDQKQANCIACHVGTLDSREPQDWLFTDFTYDNEGIPRNRALPDNADPTFFDLGLCKQPGLAEVIPPSLTVDSLCGAFKVPTLRNVALTAPYGHNGVFKTLRDIVRFYATRDTNPEQWYPVDSDSGIAIYDDVPPEYQANVNRGERPYDRKLGETPRLNDAEIDDLVSFLNTLTDR